MMGMDPMEMVKAMLPIRGKLPEREYMIFTAPMKGQEGEWLFIAVKLTDMEAEDDRDRP